MRHWLAAKAEEDKRKQEEEKTRQETLRLEQRRIEQSMLRESLQGGVPPQLVPVIYAGMAGASSGSSSMEWLHQYASQLQASQQQHVQSPTDARRDSRLIGQAPGTFHSVPPTPPQHLPPQQVEQPHQGAPAYPAYHPPGRPPPTSAPRSAAHSQLPRLTTNEMYIQQPPPHNPSSAHPLQQTQTVSEQPPASSPSIYFHHWVPPSETKTAAPQTPASKAGSNTNADPGSAHPGLSESSEYRDSPRKRKAHGGHQPQPPPPAPAPSHASPSFSSSSGSVRKGAGGGHQRNRSIAAGGGREADARRERHAEGGAAEEKKSEGRG